MHAFDKFHLGVKNASLILLAVVFPFILQQIVDFPNEKDRERELERNFKRALSDLSILKNDTSPLGQ